MPRESITILQPLPKPKVASSGEGGTESELFMNPREKRKRAKPFAANLATVKALEADGWTCCTVEQRLPHCFITRDAFNFGDILACSPSKGIMLVQATGGGNGSSRIAKIKAEARAGIWLAAGGRIQVWDWRKRAGQSERVPAVFEFEKGKP